MNEIEKHCKYVSSRGIAQNCDVFPPTIKSDTMTFNPLYYYDIKQGDKVYVITSALHHFTKLILPILERKNISIKLITGACVKGAPCEISNFHRINYIERFFINSKSITYWFTQNYDYHKLYNKIIPIPLGLDYHTLQKNIHWWGPKQTAVQQDNKIDQIYKSSHSFYERINKSFSFYQFQMFIRHGKDRYLANDALKGKQFNIFLNERLNRNTTWKLCSGYKYIISPHGNGLDCHRTYEAMCLGCLPVVRSSSLNLIYKDMPVIILNSWDSISPELLEKLAEQKIKNSRQKLMLKYWVDFINNY